MIEYGINMLLPQYTAEKMMDSSIIIVRIMHIRHRRNPRLSFYDETTSLWPSESSLEDLPWLRSLFKDF